MGNHSSHPLPWPPCRNIPAGLPRRSRHTTNPYGPHHPVYRSRFARIHPTGSRAPIPWSISPVQICFIVDHRIGSSLPTAASTPPFQPHRRRRELPWICFTVDHITGSCSPTPTCSALDPLHRRSCPPRHSLNRPPQIDFTTEAPKDIATASPPSTASCLMRFTDLSIHGTGYASGTISSTAPKPSSTALDLLPRR
jgi:hypothetical protein